MKTQRTRGISTVAIIGLVLVLAIFYTGWTAYQKKQSREAHAAAVAASIASMDKARAQWLDTMRLAVSTPRIGLAGPVGSLQTQRQNVQELPVPWCLAPNKEHLLSGMNEALEGMLAFMRNDMGKFELEDFTAQKAQAMAANFAEYDKKPTPCVEKK